MHRVSMRAFAGLTTAAITLVGAAAATGMAATTASASSTANPYNPSYQHSYRHGVIPTLAQQQKMKQWDAAHPQAAAVAAATGPNTLSYGGGIDGIGVQERLQEQGLSRLLRHPVGNADHGRQRQRQVLRRRLGRGRRGPADVQGHRHQRRAVVGRPHAVVRRRGRVHRRGGVPDEPAGLAVHRLPVRRRPGRRLVRQLGGLAGHRVRPPAGPGGGQRRVATSATPPRRRTATPTTSSCRRTARTRTATRGSTAPGTTTTATAP